MTVGTHRSQFTYDGLLRRVRIVEKENSTVQSDTTVIWCETEICEERDANGNVTRRAFSHGEEVAMITVPIPGLPPVTVLTPRYFARDHLSSVTEVTDTTQVVLARYAFDPWGRRTLISGADVTKTGFTGHQWHEDASLSLAFYRAFDSGIGRWLSEDPVRDGPNSYTYVDGNPINDLDPLGLFGIKDIWRATRRWTWPYRYYQNGKCIWERQGCVSIAWELCKGTYPTSSAKDVYSCSVCFHKAAADCDKKLLDCLNPLK